MISIIKTNLKKAGNLDYGNNPNKIIYHHPQYYGSIEALNDVMINDGYTMIGYNYYVRKDGSVYEGRPVQAVGANCYGQNSCSIGVAFEGDFENDSMSQAQFNAGVELTKYLKDKYCISEVGPHKKYYNTDCPGQNFPVQEMINGSGYSGDYNSNDDYNSIVKRAGNFLGSKCEEVQNMLISLGYDCGGYGSDSIFGKGTFESIKKFQEDYGLTIDGFAGDNTINKLKSITDCNSNTYTYERTKELNERYNNIFELQCKLIDIGYTCGGYGADGVFGKGTYESIKNFQKNHGLNVDGIAGYNTNIAIDNSVSFIKKTISVNSALNIRAGASTEFGVIGALYNGDKVYVIESYNSFSKIIYKNSYGYCSSQYLV